MRIKTQINKLGRISKNQKGFVNPPIYRGSTIIFDNYKQYIKENKKKGMYDDLYGLNRTPLSDAFESAVKGLYKCDGVVAVSSGLASISVSLLSILKKDDHILVTDSLYAPTREFINITLSKFNIKVDYYNPNISIKELEKLIKKNTKLIFIESPGTTTFDIQDIPKITNLAKKHNIITIADNTWASFLYCNPFKLGVDIVIEAATKYINGHADVLLGIICTRKKYTKKLRYAAKSLGICCGSEELYLSLRGLRTIQVRMEKSESNAIEMAKFLKKNKYVSNVFHPSLKNHINHKIWKRDYSGSSGLFSFELNKKYSQSIIEKFFKKLRYFELGYSWGGYESLITFPNTNDRKDNLKFKKTIIRIHCGLEDINDLKSDMNNALKIFDKK